MAVVPLGKETSEPDGAPAGCASSASWVRIAAATTLAASGALLVTGNRRLGLLTAVAGTALVMLDQQDVVRAWWEALPGYLEDIDDMLGRAQNAVADLSAQGERLREAFGR